MRAVQRIAIANVLGIFTSPHAQLERSRQLDSEIGALPVSPVLLRVDDENDVVNDERPMDKSVKSASASSRTPAKSAPSSV